MIIKKLLEKIIKKNRSKCLFSGLPCETAAIEKDKIGRCVCLNCEAWLAKNVDGFGALKAKQENEALHLHLEAVREVLGVSIASSRPLSCYASEWKDALEHYSNGPDGERARKLLNKRV